MSCRVIINEISSPFNLAPFAIRRGIATINNPYAAIIAQTIVRRHLTQACLKTMI
jgi:hypothetical protein